MIPDRQAESRAPTVADEIPLANVIRVERFERPLGFWIARIGPHDGGIWHSGRTPDEAVANLARWTAERMWPWDSGWRDRMTGD